VFNRRGVDKDERALAIERAEIESLAKDRDDEKAILERSFAERLKGMLMGRKTVSGPKGFKAGGKVTDEMLAEYTPGQWKQITVANDKVMEDIEDMKKSLDESLTQIDKRFENKGEKLQRGDELPPGVLKMVKARGAVKRTPQPGGKAPGGQAHTAAICKRPPAQGRP